jgi:amino-acid N-acetyltransferase
MKIEFAKEKDLEEIQQILSESDLPYNDLKMRHLESFFIIRSENNIIAVIGAEICNSSALLRSLAVLPDYRNRNFASQLLTYMESYLKTMKISMIYLLTTTQISFL